MNTPINQDYVTVMQNRAITCFLGHIIGDALNYGQSKGFLTLFDVLSSQNGQISGDAILQGYLQRAPTLNHIFSNPKNGNSAKSRQLAERFNSASLDNSPLIRTTALGILLAPMVAFSIRESPLLTASNLINLTAIDTQLSHSNHTAIIGTSVFVALVAGNIAHGKSGLSRTLTLAETIARQDPVICEIYNRSISCQQLNPPATINPSYLGTALSLAIQRTIEVAHQLKCFHTAIMSTVKLGGDTAINCAVVGAAIGGLVDLNEMPREWVESSLCHHRRQYLAQSRQLITLGFQNYTYTRSRHISVRN